MFHVKHMQTDPEELRRHRWEMEQKRTEFRRLWKTRILPWLKDAKMPRKHWGIIHHACWIAHREKPMHDPRRINLEQELFEAFWEQTIKVAWTDGGGDLAKLDEKSKQECFDSWAPGERDAVIFQFN